jgi:hypothetical protein
MHEYITNNPNNYHNITNIFQSEISNKMTDINFLQLKQKLTKTYQDTNIPKELKIL